MGTRARVFSQTFEHGNSENEIRQSDRRRRTKRGVSMEKKYSEHKRKKSRRPITS